MKGWIAIAAIGLALISARGDVTKGEFGAAKADEAPRKNSTTSDVKETNSASKRSTYPFHGNLDSVDKNEKNLTLRGKKKNRVILLTSETRIQRDGVKAKLEDAKPGERVSGSVRKNAEGKEEAVTVNLKGEPRN